MEMKLYNMMQDGKAAHALLNKMKKEGFSCSQEARKALWKIVNRGLEAEKDFFAMFEALIRKTVRRMWADKNLEEDLMQEARFALYNAAKTYDPDRGAKFSTYAYYIIMREVKRALARLGFNVKLPEEVMDNIYKVEQAMEDGTTAVKEIAERTGFSPEKVNETLQLRPMVKNYLSFNEDVEGESGLQETVAAAETWEPENEVMQSEEGRLVRMAMDTLLPAEDCRIMRDLFGFDHDKLLSMAEIAKKLGCSKTTVYNRKERALRTLRQSQDLLDCYLAS